MEFIPDPMFAAFVNEKNEIVINDTLYVITEDEGMFFAHITDSTTLLNYISDIENKKANDFLSKKMQPDMKVCEKRQLYGGVHEINDRVSR